MCIAIFVHTPTLWKNTTALVLFGVLSCRNENSRVMVSSPDCCTGGPGFNSWPEALLSWGVCGLKTCSWRAEFKPDVGVLILRTDYSGALLLGCSRRRLRRFRNCSGKRLPNLFHYMTQECILQKENKCFLNSRCQSFPTVLSDIIASRENSRS
jgi:hypothetical protein